MGKSLSEKFSKAGVPAFQQVHSVKNLLVCTRSKENWSMPTDRQVRQKNFTSEFARPYIRGSSRIHRLSFGALRNWLSQSTCRSGRHRFSVAWFETATYRGDISGATMSPVVLSPRARATQSGRIRSVKHGRRDSVEGG